MRPGHGKAGRMQRLDDAELAVHGVRRGQELARRLAAQHEAAAVGGSDEVRRIRLAALELLDFENLETKKFPERRGVDAVALFDGLGADELLEHAGASLPYNPQA